MKAETVAPTVVAPSAEPAIEAIGASKTFRAGSHDLTAVHAVDLRIEPRTMTAIMGPSGAGKSTLLQLLGGLDQPTKGEIRIGGVATAGLRDRDLTLLRRRQIGFVFQFFNLLPSLTAWQNVSFPARVDGMARARARDRAISLLGLVGLGDHIDHLPSQLSGGQLQRVAIARALVLEPPVVLADEPTGNLDQRSGAEIVELLHSLTEATAVVVVTHDPAVAHRADRQLVMVDGAFTGHTPPEGLPKA